MTEEVIMFLLHILFSDQPYKNRIVIKQNVFCNFANINKINV